MQSLAIANGLFQQRGCALIDIIHTLMSRPAVTVILPDSSGSEDRSLLDRDEDLVAELLAPPRAGEFGATAWSSSAISIVRPKEKNADATFFATSTPSFTAVVTISEEEGSLGQTLYASINGASYMSD